MGIHNIAWLYNTCLITTTTVYHKDTLFLLGIEGVTYYYNDVVS